MPDDLDRELRCHLELEAEEQRDAGLSADQAKYAARRALGNQLMIKEDVRALSPWAAVEDLLHDLHYGFRILRRQPAFALVAALTLAIGVGAATTIFSVVDAVLLRPLPYPDSDRLAMIWENVNLPAYKNSVNTPAPGNFTDWRRGNSTFTDLAAIRYASWSLTGSGEPIRLEGERTSASFFSVLRVDPIVGRAFTADEERAASRVAVIGYALWADRFGSNPNVVGRTIYLSDEPYTVVGVMPRGFHFPDPDDQVWLPLGLTPEQLANHGSHYLRVMGRLKPAMSLGQARADLENIARQLTLEYPESNTGVGVTIRSLMEQTVGDVRTPLLVIFGMVGLLLLMVCANVSSLLLARASAREREFAVRAALGASRRRMIRQLLTESLLLASAGGALGLALAVTGIDALRWLAPSNLPRLDELGIDKTVAAFNFVAALVAASICGAVPLLQRERRALTDGFKETGASATGERLRLRNHIVVAETALGFMVLVGAGLLFRTYVQLTALPIGFDPEGLLTFRLILPTARYAGEPQRTAFYRDVAAQIEALPGVQSSAAISFLPLVMAGRTAGISVEGEPPRAPGEMRFVDFRSVSPGYFRTMRIPLLAGRDVSWSDIPSTPPVIVVSETMARTLWPKRDALAKRIKLGRPEENVPWLTVVGVVADVRQMDLVSVPRPALYLPASQDAGTGEMLRDWVVRTAGNPAALAPAIRSTIWRVDPTLPIARVQPMASVRSASTATEQFNLAVVGAFAALALVLASVGLYGVIAYSVEQRTRELGIRVALGARQTEVMRLLLAKGARLTAIGLMIGFAASLGLGRLMSTVLFGVSGHDPFTFAAVGLLLLLVSLVASFIPAQRATRIDPVAALKT